MNNAAVDTVVSEEIEIGGNSATELKKIAKKLDGPAWHVLNNPYFYSEGQKKIISVGLVSPEDLHLDSMSLVEWMQIFIENKHSLYDFLPPESGVYIHNNFIQKPEDKVTPKVVPVLMKFMPGFMNVPSFFVQRKDASGVWHLDAEPIDEDRIVPKDEKWFVLIKS